MEGVSALATVPPGCDTPPAPPLPGRGAREDMTSPFDLSGKIAIVTGANTGIGQGIALALAAAGADIAAVGRTPAQETVEKVRAQIGRASCRERGQIWGVGAPYKKT